MTIYHRNLGHNWNVARRETNYALFGNARGYEADTRPGGPSKKPLPYEREMRWESKLFKAEFAVRLNCQNASERDVSLAWLRYKEFEA